MAGGACVRVLDAENAVPFKSVAHKLDFIAEPRYYMHSLRQSLKLISRKDLGELRRAIGSGLLRSSPKQVDTAAPTTTKPTR